MEKRPVSNKGISSEEDFGFCLKHSRKDSVIREMTRFGTRVISLMRSGKSRKRETHQMEEEERAGGKTTEEKASRGQCSGIQRKFLSHGRIWSPSPSLQGKFIRIHFGTTGKLASADIETCKYAHWDGWSLGEHCKP